MRAHDGDDSVREAALGELDLVDEVLQAFDIELAVAVDQLRGAAVVLHQEGHWEVAESEAGLK